VTQKLTKDGKERSNERDKIRRRAGTVGLEK